MTFLHTMVIYTNDMHIMHDYAISKCYCAGAYIIRMELLDILAITDT